MIPLPKWIKDIFDQGQCPHCQKSLHKKGVFGIGIREEKVKNKKVFSLCYEYQCPSCTQRTVFTGFPTTFEDFIADLIDVSNVFPSGKIDPEELEAQYYEDEGVNEPPKPKSKKQGMTEKEAKEGMKLIDETEFYEDLLDKLGIKKLNRETKEDENK